MNSNYNDKDNLINIRTHEFLQIRALCDEMNSNLCQAKALLEPIDDENFFKCFETEGLRYYFYAINTIIECILEVKDEIYRLVDNWEKASDKEISGILEKKQFDSTTLERYE